jgi:hypothetical protein
VSNRDTDALTAETEKLVALFIEATRQMEDLILVQHRRAGLAWQLRDQGLTYREIGDLVGLSGTRVHQLVLKYDATLQEGVA